MEISDQEAMPFEGDVFGGPDDYNDDDFGQLQPGDPESADIEDDDEQEEQVNFESDWEPERLGARAGSLSFDEDPPSQDMDNQWSGHDDPIINASHSQEEGHIVNSHFVVRYSDKYPNRQAGAPTQKTQSGDDIYRTALHDSSNPWAPFSSQMDWEIAKWAKLRGAGSTAFSDLLAIKGVSHYCGLSPILT
jgi:hypothetical protein